MLRVFAVALVTILSGCVSTDMVNSSYSQSETAVKVEKWEPIMEGSKINVDVNYEYEIKLSNGRLLNQSKWNDYLKPFVSGYSQDKADTMIDGLSRYYWEYDKVDKKIRYEPLRYMSEPYSRSNYVSMQGSISKDKTTGLLKFKYYGPSWIFAKSVKIVADDFTWQSQELEFYTDNSGGKVWEYAYLDISKPEFRKVADKIASSKEVIIRFQGQQYYSDLSLPKRMKSDLMAMLDVIDVLNTK
jgi:hypothetical protein